MAARMLWTVLICAEIAATSLARASTCPTDPADPTGRKQWCGCPTSSATVGAATVVDMSSRASAEFLRSAKEKGITTIFRYYDWPHKPDESVKLERRWRLISSTCQADETSDKVVTKNKLTLFILIVCGWRLCFSIFHMIGTLGWTKNVQLTMRLKPFSSRSNWGNQLVRRYFSA